MTLRFAVDTGTVSRVIIVGDEEVASAPVEEARLLAVLSSLA